MGLEARCAARHEGRGCAGKLYLDTEALVFRGDFRLSLPLAEIRSAEVSGGWLAVTSAATRAEFQLGEAAPKWAQRLLNPRSLLDKLGVKPGMQVSVLGVDDPGFLHQLQERVPDAALGTIPTAADLLFVGLRSSAGLTERLVELQEKLKPAGAVWLIRPRGNPEVAESDVLEAGRAAGLVDVKVARFSGTHTAEKFVRPAHRRGGAASPVDPGTVY